MQYCLRVLICMSLFVAGIITFQTQPAYAQTANPGDNLVVCGNSNWGGISSFNTSRMRAKLSNTANFGPSGTYSTSTFTYANIGTPTAANLASNNCNIWFSGYDPGAAYTALSTFAANGGFVIGGCDNSNYDAVCNGVGVNVTNYSNIGGGYSTALPINPLTCDAGTPNATLTLTTAGGASSYFSTGETLARYSNAAALPLVIVDDNYVPSYVLTGDIDMFTTYNSQVTNGPNITSDQDKFIANVFKLAADKVTGLLGTTGEPNCGNISSGVVATNDDFTSSSIAAGGNTPSVYSNDLIDAVTVTTGSVNPTITSTGGLSGVTINSNGTLTIPSTTPTGTYTVTYRICDATDATECDTATVLIAVTAVSLPSTCPAGFTLATASPNPGFANVLEPESVDNPAQAGNFGNALLAANSNTARIQSNDIIVLDLTDIVAQNETLILRGDANANSNMTVEVTTVDPTTATGVDWTNIGTIQSETSGVNDPGFLPKALR